MSTTKRKPTYKDWRPGGGEQEAKNLSGKPKSEGLVFKWGLREGRARMTLLTREEGGYIGTHCVARASRNRRDGLHNPWRENQKNSKKHVYDHRCGSPPFAGDGVRALWHITPKIMKGICAEIENLFTQCQGANVGARAGLWAPPRATDAAPVTCGSASDISLC